MHCTGIAVNQGVILSVDVFPDPAVPPVPLINFTVARTQLATDLFVFQLAKKRREFATQETFLQTESLGLG
jgi:hypothetical protein